MRRPAGGQNGSRPKGGVWRSLPPRRRTERLMVTVSYKGGGECWYLIESRGVKGMMPGYLALHDVMERINSGRDLPFSPPE